MCGRFVGAFSAERLWNELSEGIKAHGLRASAAPSHSDRSWSADYNIAPSKNARVLLEEDGALALATSSWGLRQSWAPKGRAPQLLINARSESVLDKRSFRDLVGPQRCIVPMDGFYEWRRTDGDKQPFFCERADGHLLLVAAIWDTVPGDEGGRAFCLLTRTSGTDLSGIHDRCPVHFDVDDALEWLAAGDPPMELCSSQTQPILRPRAVTRRVNSVKNNGPDLLGPEDDDRGTGALTLF